MSPTVREIDANEPQRFGERLVAGRERVGLSQVKVAEQLRIGTAVVAALEAGDYQQVGAQVFVRGYLRRYAELIGESPEDFAAASPLRGLGDAAVQITGMRFGPMLGMRERRRIGLWPVLTVVLLLCVAGVVWWAQRASAPRAAAHPQAVTQEIVVAPPTLPDGAHPGAPPAASPAAAPAALPPAGSPVTVGHRQLRFNFAGESWLEVYDAEGTRLYWDLGRSGDAPAVSGVPPFRITIGNPALVSLAYDGRALALPALRAGTTLHATLDGSGAFAVLR
jgi:cytoskeleton protein RodZ